MAMLPMMENRDDLIRAEMDYFRNIVRNGTAAPHAEWERQANLLDGLLPDEEFYLRFIEKNFDGSPINKWVLFGQKPNTPMYRGEKPIFTIMTIEKIGQAGTYDTPHDSHLDGLRMLVLDWREGRHAALERMEREKEKANDMKMKDAINEAQGRVDDMFWIWKRAMGEDMNFTLGADGKGPNHGGKHFGAVFDRNKTASGIILP
tara:strand:- start:9355 stop:9966 length:612 start_codon:yes stop_codon:yes gene_type:complete